MAFTLTYAKVSPMIPMPVPTPMQAKVTAWCTVLEVLLNERYGDAITTEREPVFVSAAADAITRRLVRPTTSVVTQAAAAANVRYTDRGPLGGWFMPEELAELDAVAGLGGGIRSVRTPAPDGVRFGNLSARLPFDTVDESGEGDLVLEGS